MTEDWGALPDQALLSDGQLLKLTKILEVLASDEHAPTPIRDPRQAALRHIADSLSALEIEQMSRARRIADLGSGAGFPGLPLAIALPDAEVSLVESQHRRCEFLERACAEVGISNARVVCARAEEWSEGMGRCDAVVARALAAQPVVLEYAAPLLRLGGAFVDWRGRRSPEDEKQGDHAAQALGMQRVAIHHAPAIEGASDHHLHVFIKVTETPERFPRRAGMARKRPLGAAPRLPTR